MSIRAQKVSSLIKQVLAQPITELAHEYSAGLATVTTVRMTEDLQHAKVYVSVYGGKMKPAEFLTVLEKHNGQIRSYVGSNVRLRFTPEIRFFLDDTLDQMEHIQNLIDKARKEDGRD